MNTSKIFTLRDLNEEDNFSLNGIFDGQEFQGLLSTKLAQKNQSRASLSTGLNQKEFESFIQSRSPQSKRSYLKKQKKIQKDKQKSDNTRERQKKQQNQTKKERRRNGKWDSQDRYNLVIAYGRQFANTPHATISWQSYKQNIFPTLAQNVGKTPKQCKSYDQRLKKDFFKKQNMDIIDFVLHEIETKYMHRVAAKQIYEKIMINMKERSKHMEFFKKQIEMLHEIQKQLDELLVLQSYQ